MHQPYNFHVLKPDDQRSMFFNSMIQLYIGLSILRHAEDLGAQHLFEPKECEPKYRPKSSAMVFGIFRLQFFGQNGKQIGDAWVLFFYVLYLDHILLIEINLFRLKYR